MPPPRKSGWKFWLLFIILSFVGGVVIWIWYPDTRNMPLEEISALFGDEDEVAIYQEEIEIDSNTHAIVDHHGEKDGGSARVEKMPADV